MQNNGGIKGVECSMALISPIVDIAIVSFAMAIVSQILQRKFIDRKKMKESQKQMKESQKRIQELLKKNDEKSKLEAQRLQNEMLRSINENLKGSMKHIVVSMPIFLGVFAAVGFLYSQNLVELPFALPVLHRNLAFEITPNISWVWWYLYCSIAFSIVFSIVFKAVEKAKKGS